MLIHHLFGFPERLQYSYISLFSLYHAKGEVILGYFGLICVTCFMFLSGYGLYKSNKGDFQDIIQKDIKHLKKLMLNYWVVFLIVIPVGLIFFPMVSIFKDNSPLVFLENFIGLKITYCGEWWFLYDYILLMFAFPFLFICMRSNGPLMLIFSCFIASCFALQNNYYTPLYWQFVFIIGMAFSKYNVFTKLHWLMEKIRLDNLFMDIVMIILLFEVWHYMNFTNPFNVFVFITPFFLYHMVHLLKKIRFDRLFAYLGKNSTNLWLTHTFFIYYYFQGLVFLPKVSILILIWLMTLTLALSFGIKKIIAFINDKIKTVAIKKCEV